MEKNNILTKVTDFFNNLDVSNRIMICIAGIIILILTIILILMKWSKKHRTYQPPEPQDTNVHLSELLKQLNDGTNNPKPNVNNVRQNMNPDNNSNNNYPINNYNNHIQNEIDTHTDVDEKKPFTKVQANINIEINLNNENEEIRKEEFTDNPLDINDGQGKQNIVYSQNETISSNVAKNNNDCSQQNVLISMANSNVNIREENENQKKLYDVPSIKVENNYSSEQSYNTQKIEEKHKIVSKNTNESVENTNEDNIGIPEFDFDYFNHFLEGNNNIKKENIVKTQNSNKNIDSTPKTNSFVEQNSTQPNTNVSKNNVSEEYNKTNPHIHNQQPTQSQRPMQPQPCSNNTNISSNNYGNGNNPVPNYNERNCDTNNGSNGNVQQNKIMQNQSNIIPNPNSIHSQNGNENVQEQDKSKISLGDYFKQYTGSENNIKPKDERHFSRLDDEDYVMSILKKKI